jgi:AcrR family transcriptional regulator
MTSRTTSPVAETSSPYERVAQKSRTREAILAGARALMERGEAVSVTAAAQEAGVSKATAYRYFPDPATLAAEAGLAVRVAPYEEIVAGVPDLRERLVALSAYFFDLACDNEAAFRQFLARGLDGWLAGRATRRGARRVEGFERALDEAGEAVPVAVRKRLVRALAGVTGAEAMLALYDVAGASRAEARATVVATARMLVDGHLGAAPEKNTERSSH